MPEYEFLLTRVHNSVLIQENASDKNEPFPLCSFSQLLVCFQSHRLKHSLAYILHVTCISLLFFYIDINAIEMPLPVVACLICRFEAANLSLS